MRVKSLLVTMMLLGLWAIRSPAQVYSVNIVGYINLTVKPGLNLIVNQLEAISDDLSSFLPNPPDGTVVFRYDPFTGSYQDGITFLDGVGWYATSSTKARNISKRIPVGEGFFIYVPTLSATTFTLVGEVLLASTNQLPGGYSLKGSVIPQGDTLLNLDFPSTENDRVYRWDADGQTFYPPSTFSRDNPGWFPQDPSVRVGEGFLLFRDPLFASPENAWVRIFTVGAPAPLPSLTAATSLTPPSVRGLTLDKGKVTLDVQNPYAEAYDVQFSSDGTSWNSVARNQTGVQWTSLLNPGPKGYFRLTTPSF